MTRQLLAKTFDPNTLAAIEFLAGEDINAILATWFRMLALASRDPEGCVRLTPGLQMDTEALAGYFHCTGEAVEATIQIMEQLQLLTRDETDNLQLTACAGANRHGKTKSTQQRCEPARMLGEQVKGRQENQHPGHEHEIPVIVKNVTEDPRKQDLEHKPDRTQSEIFAEMCGSCGKTAQCCKKGEEIPVMTQADHRGNVKAESFHCFKQQSYTGNLCLRNMKANASTIFLPTRSMVHWS